MVSIGLAHALRKIVAIQIDAVLPPERKDSLIKAGLLGRLRRQILAQFADTDAARPSLEVLEDTERQFYAFSSQRGNNRLASDSCLSQPSGKHFEFLLQYSVAGESPYDRLAAIEP